MVVHEVEVGLARVAMLGIDVAVQTLCGCDGGLKPSGVLMIQTLHTVMQTTASVVKPAWLGTKREGRIKTPKDFACDADICTAYAMV